MLGLVDHINHETVIVLNMPDDVQMVRKVHAHVEKNPLLSAKGGTMLLFVYDNGDLKLFYVAGRSRDKEEIFLANVVTGDNLTLFARNLPKRVTMARTVLTGINVRTLRKVRQLRTGETKASRRSTGRRFNG